MDAELLQTENTLLHVFNKFIIDDQQDATFWFIYLFVPNQLHMFRAMFSPIVMSTWLYLQLLM